MAETRRRTTRAELVAFYASAKPGWWHFDNFPLADNPRFNAVDWNSFDDEGYLRLTRAQQILNSVALLQQQVFQNGVFGVLGFGKHTSHLRAAIAEFGWPELSRCFDALFVDAFGELEPAHWMRAEHHLKDFFEDVAGFSKGLAFDDWFSGEVERGELARAILEYCRAHESVLFEIVE